MEALVGPDRGWAWLGVGLVTVLAVAGVKRAKPDEPTTNDGSASNFDHDPEWRLPY
ncbi:hypothetical protein [Micromonospora sp. NPDC002717]|uniref:hypothetical protein n=1 Tax=Micromonospora sp. NPDC002717 TaxID=3154424 RepID=UPI0033227CF8